MYEYYLVYQTEKGKIGAYNVRTAARIANGDCFTNVRESLMLAHPSLKNEQFVITSITLLSEPHIPVPQITQITNPEYVFELLHTYFIEVGTQGAVRTMTYRFGEEPYFMDVSGARWELDEIIAAIKSSGNVRVFALGNIK